MADFVHDSNDFDPDPNGTNPVSISETAYILSQYYCELLETPRVASNCDFLHAGATSLSIVQLRTRIARKFHVQLSLAQIYEHSRLDDLAQLVDNSPKTASPATALQVQSSAAVVADDGTFPITSYQTDLLEFAKSSPSSPHLVIRLAVEIVGEFDIGCFETALQAFARRHLAFTLELVEDPRGPRARCRPDIVPLVKRLGTVELTKGSGLVFEALNEPFDLNRPLTPHVVYAHPEQIRHVIGFAVHHMTADGSSVELLLRELASDYSKLIAGQTIDDAAPEIDYPVFAGYEQTRTQNGTIDTERKFWEQELVGLRENGNFASDIGQQGDHSFGRLFAEISPDVLIKINALARRTKTTPFTIFLSAWTRALSLQTGEDEIVVVSSIALRDDPEFRGIYGCFWNGLLLRVRPQTNTARDWLSAAHGTLQKVQPYRYFPYRHIKDLIAAVGLGQVEPRFMCTMHHAHPASIFPIPRAKSRFVWVDDDQSWSHLELHVWYRSDAAYSVIDFYRDKFSDQQVQAVFKSMIGSIEEMFVEHSGG
jgi:hypothetical protein